MDIINCRVLILVLNLESLGSHTLKVPLLGPCLSVRQEQDGAQDKDRVVVPVEDVPVVSYLWIAMNWRNLSLFKACESEVAFAIEANPVIDQEDADVLGERVDRSH